jgi:hypothetical protein
MRKEGGGTVISLELAYKILRRSYLHITSSTCHATPIQNNVCYQI